jgi:hypothetical protein
MEQTLPTFPQMINEKQAARILSVSVGALRRWRHDGRGPQFARVERCVRYDIRELTRFLENNSSDNKKAADGESAAKQGVRSDHATTRQT